MSEIGVKLTGDNSQFRTMMADSVREGATKAGELSREVGKKLFEMRDVSRAVTTALGIDYQKIANGVARMFTGVSKEEEEAFKRIDTLSKQQADAAIANARARLSDEQKYQLALREREKLVKQIDSTEAKTAVDRVKLYEKQIELEKTVAGIQAYEAKQAEVRAKRFEEEMDARSKAAGDAHDAMIESLSLNQRERVLRQEIADLQATINSGLLSEADLKRMSNALSERQAKLAAALKEERKAEFDAAQELAKVRFDALPTEEKIAAYTESIATLQKLIAQEKKDGLSTVKDELTLAQNQVELGKLRDQQTKQETRDTKEQVKAEEEKAEFQQRQTEIQQILSKGVGALTDGDKDRLKQLAGQNSILQEQIKIVGDLTKQWDGFTVSVTRTGNDYQSQSTTALTGVRDRLKKDLSIAKSQPKPVSVTNLTGYDPGISFLQSEIASVEKELNLRAKISAYAERYGESAATYKFGDADTQRALRDLTSTQQQTLTALNQISNQMAASGLFPKT